jgi:hypothetical protein
METAKGGDKIRQGVSHPSGATFFWAKATKRRQKSLF